MFLAITFLIRTEYTRLTTCCYTKYTGLITFLNRWCELIVRFYLGYIVAYDTTDRIQSNRRESAVRLTTALEDIRSKLDWNVYDGKNNDHHFRGRDTARGRERKRGRERSGYKGPQERDVLNLGTTIISHTIFSQTAIEIYIFKL